VVGEDIFVTPMNDEQVHVYGEKTLSNSSAAFPDELLNELKCIGRMSCRDRS